MESVACIFCQEANDDVAISENGYDGRKCVKCGLVYISPRPSLSETVRLYSHSHSLLYADSQLQFGRYKKKEAGETIKIIEKFKHDGSILELGAGGGAFLIAARHRGFTPYAIEINPLEAAWINDDVKVPCESVALNPNTFDGKKFDIVYHRDVLSHLHDPISTFKLINQSLKDKGLVIFETGNIADVKPSYLRLFSQFLYPDHLYFFGENSIQLLLERTGFERLAIVRIPIVLSLLLEKALWSIKERLKDGNSVKAMTADHIANRNNTGRLSAKRKLRLLYRYTSHYLEKLGGAFPKDGWPLKLVVVAGKR